MCPWSFELSSKMIFSRVLNSRFDSGSLSSFFPLDMRQCTWSIALLSFRRLYYVAKKGGWLSREKAQFAGRGATPAFTSLFVHPWRCFHHIQ